MVRDRAGRSDLAVGRVVAVVAIAAALAAASSLACHSDAAPAAAAGPPPARIVSLLPQATELLVALGESNRLVGRITSESDPVLRGLPDVGDPVRPNLELIARLGPDLVIAWQGADAAGDLRELFGSARIWLTKSERLDDLWANIEGLGVLLHREPEAAELAGRLRHGLTRVAESAATRPAPGVLYVVWEDPPMAAGPGSFLHELLEIAGGRNVFGDAALAWPTVSFEAIVARDPDILIWPRRHSDSAPLDEREGWRLVPAVRRGDVRVVDPDLFAGPSVRVVEAARTLAAALHPGLPTSERLEALETEPSIPEER
jgi:iron complex transport system substrate-binding protein